MLRNASIETTFAGSASRGRSAFFAAGSADLADAAAPAFVGAAGGGGGGARSDLRVASRGGAGALAGSVAARGSSLKPNGTEGSLKPVMESNGIVSRSGLREKLRLTEKASLVDFEVPELVLQDDRHLVGIALQHRRRDDHARRLGLERDVEMMLARQAVARRVAKHLAHHRAQRFLNQQIVTDVVGGHGNPQWKTLPGRLAESPADGKCACADESGGFCCRAPPNPA